MSLDANTAETIRRAEILYRRIAEGSLKLYDQESWRWLEPDRAVARDHADRLKILREQT
jgi:hypothetical protein